MVYSCVGPFINLVWWWNLHQITYDAVQTKILWKCLFWFQMDVSWLLIFYQLSHFHVFKRLMDGCSLTLYAGRTVSHTAVCQSWRCPWRIVSNCRTWFEKTTVMWIREYFTQYVCDVVRWLRWSSSPELPNAPKGPCPMNESPRKIDFCVVLNIRTEIPPIPLWIMKWLQRSGNSSIIGIGLSKVIVLAVKVQWNYDIYVYGLSNVIFMKY